MSHSVICTATTSQTDSIIRELKAAGFTGSDISVLMADKAETRDFAYEKNTKAPEGATAGAGTGLLLGGTLGWLAGIGMLAIPGLGPFIAAGPIMAALSGAAVGGTLGGLTGALVGMGIPEIEAKHYEEKVKAGHSLISVHSETGAERQRAKDIFERAGAKDISTVGETSGKAVTV
ncbi:MAG: hypothetical protein C0478_13840 [Planctomyces sp.]|nr:hypothetical protein [Planctomyces sp.]